ncbi:hypothetical protein M405DRAFT_933089 [Rhizopogon salebrosus TDB-379]|nr:hypothetical protein M405DRAFT_933089 [Rhizopogon salebrosus TDB-379]
MMLVDIGPERNMTKTCYIDRLSNELLCMIFELVCEEDQTNFQDKLGLTHWDDWRDNIGYYHSNYERESHQPSPLLSAVRVCERWKCLLSQMPSLWTVLQISFQEGAASFEHARTFLRHSGTLPLKITVLWDDPSCVDPGQDNRNLADYGFRQTTLGGIQLVLLIQELYVHAHRWREFTLRTTTVVHTSQVLLLLSRPSVHPAHMLEKLHLHLVHNKCHAAYSNEDLALFPHSAPPIRDLVLFGIDWDWVSFSKFSPHLVDLRIHLDPYMDDTEREVGVAWRQILGELPNLQSLSIEVDIREFDFYDTEDTVTTTLSQLRSLTIKSRTMARWAIFLGCNICMPNLRVLTLDGVGRQPSDLIGSIEALTLLVDPDTEEPQKLLELDELHLLYITLYAGQAALVHRMYEDIATIKVLTLGPGAWDGNAALAMGLLPTSSELADLPLPGLQTLIIFDAPKDVVRRIVLERMSVTGPLEELYYKEEEGYHMKPEDESVPNDWQHQVEKYHRIGSVRSSSYRDIVGRQWSEL